MNQNTIKLLLYFGLLTLITAASFALVLDANPANDDLGIGTIGLVVGLLIREGSSILSASTVSSIASSMQPTTTVNTAADQPVTVNTGTPVAAPDEDDEPLGDPLP